jgi:hypothetical protein
MFGMGSWGGTIWRSDAAVGGGLMKEMGIVSVEHGLVWVGRLCAVTSRVDDLVSM